MSKVVKKPAAPVFSPEPTEIPTITSQKVMSGPPVEDKPSLRDGNIEATNPDDFMRPLTEEEATRIRALTEEDILSEAIIAKDFKLPSYLDLQPRDPIWAFRWVNRNYDGEGGNRYTQMCALGFANALPDDVAGKMAPQVAYQDGGIICQDLILMKIRKDILFGYYKANIIKSNRTFSRANVLKEARSTAESSLRSNLQETGLPKSAYQGKLGLYVPEKIPGEV